MAKREKRHTNHSCYFAAPILLLAFALKGFLPMASALSASDPRTEIQTQSRQQEQIRDLQRQQQMNLLQDQQRQFQIQRRR